MKITEEHFQTGEVIQSTGSSLKSEECISPPLHELRCNLQVISSWCTCISHQKSSGGDKSQVCIREQGLWKCKFYFIFLFCGSTLCEPQRVLGRGQTPRVYRGTRFQKGPILQSPNQSNVQYSMYMLLVSVKLQILQNTLILFFSGSSAPRIGLLGVCCSLTKRYISI